MKAKDTTLVEKLVKARGEGYSVGYNKALAQLAGMTEECKQMGRKEVVEFIERCIRIYFWDDVNLWQAQKKEWGIDED